MNPVLKGALLGGIGTLVLLGLIGLLIVLTGGYNVAATDRHTPLVGWALETTYVNAVQGASDGIEAPEFTGEMVDKGASDYKEYCAHCHGGIGEGRAEWAAAMRPMPPALARAASQWSEEEIFWLVKHGVKMSGMPAFGPTHDDEALWNIAAFVDAMPDMSAERYKSFAGGHEH